jgi:hypothetical protein
MQLPAATLGRWRPLRLPSDARAAPQPGSTGLQRPDPPHTTNLTRRPARDDRAARLHCGCPEQHPEQHIGYRPMALSPMTIKKILILRRPPPGPAFGRPEDRLRGHLEEPAPAKAGDASALIRRSLIPVPPVIPPKQALTEFARESRHLAPLAGRGRKLRITRLPGEGQLPPPSKRRAVATAPSPQPSLPLFPPPRAGEGQGGGKRGEGICRGSALSMPPTTVPHRQAPTPSPSFPRPPSFPRKREPRAPSRPVAPSPRSLQPDERPIEFTHGSDPQTRQET